MGGYKIHFAMLILSLCLIQAAPAVQYEAAGTLSAITDYPEERWEIGISGENVIWVEPGDGYGEQALYLYNIPGRQTLKVASSKYTTFHPEIEKNSILWGEKTETSGPVRLIAYDILSGNSSLIDPSLSNQDFPATDGDSVVWFDSRTGGYTNIYIMKDPNGKSTLFHSSDTSDKHNPAISEGYVYWVEKGVLYRKNIESGNPVGIISGMPPEYSLSGSRAVWEYDNSGEKDIALLDTGLIYAETIVEKPGDQINPAIDGENIVWQEYDGGLNRIRIKNIDTGISADIHSSRYVQSDPEISGNRIVWFDSTPGKKGVRLFELDNHAKPSADFTSDAKASLPPLTVHFVPEITTPVNIKPEMIWDFGDGTTSSEVEPEHTYTMPGIYNVTLTISNEFGESLVFKPSHVIIGELPRPDFTSDKTSGKTPLTVMFKDDSSGPYDTRTWDFGDGIGSVLKSPVHTYETPGIYTVSLTLSNEYGSVTEEKFAYISAGQDNGIVSTEAVPETVVRGLNMVAPDSGDNGGTGSITLFDSQNFLELLNSE